MVLILFYLCKSILWITLVICLFVIFAYFVNAQRKDDDPQKRNYHISAMLLAPFTWPLFLIGFISLFLVRALFYCFFLILFISSLIISLVIIPQETSEPSGLEKMAARIGEALLKANMSLIKLFLRPWADEPETI
jgi:hypothetical protein